MVKTQKAQKKSRRAPRPAQLIADTVAVICPHCSEPQPNPRDGSEQWEKADFLRFYEQRNNETEKACSSCDAPMFIFNGNKVEFS